MKSQSKDRKGVSVSRSRRGPRRKSRRCRAQSEDRLFDAMMTTDVAQPASLCPHEPWSKQSAFLDLDCLEAFYGGAAGGGKSEALLMAALAYVHVPGYAALILRKDTQRLRLAGGLIPRSHEWLAGKGAKWNDNERCWTFRTGQAPATIRFGYLRDPHDKYRYASSEFQFIAFDELSEFVEEDYLFLFSRLRRTKQVDVPLRMRSASNPGGIGHAWVKSRFIPPSEQLPVESATVLWHNDRAYVPATIDDNPALDAEEYRHSLKHLPPLWRERLMNGDWTIREDALLRAHWLRYYRIGGEQLELQTAEGKHLAEVLPQYCRRFVTVDPAGTSADRAREKRGKPPCSTAIQVWDQSLDQPFPALILRHAWRGLVGFDELCQQLRDVYRHWQPEQIWIENEKLGQAAVDVLRKELPIATIPTGGKDKVARATWLIARLERGEVFLPAEPWPWRLALEAELLSWTGHPDEVCDQIDAAAYAAIVAERSSIRAIRLMGNRVVVS